MRGASRPKVIGSTLSVLPQKAAVFHFKRYTSALYDTTLRYNTSEGDEIQQLYQEQQNKCKHLSTFVSMEKREHVSSGIGGKGDIGGIGGIGVTSSKNPSMGFTELGLTCDDFAVLNSHIQRRLEITKKRAAKKLKGEGEGEGEEEGERDGEGEGEGEEEMRSEISALLNSREEQWLQRLQHEIITANFLLSSTPKAGAEVPWDKRMGGRKVTVRWGSKGKGGGRGRDRDIEGSSRGGVGVGIGKGGVAGKGSRGGEQRRHKGGE